MKLSTKLLVWLGMMACIAAVVLIIDVRRAAAHSCRVEIADHALAAAILTHFPFQPHHYSKVVDEVPKTPWQILLDKFPRHIQHPITTRLAHLSDPRKASLTATHTVMRTRSGKVVVGLDRAAQDWLSIPLADATPQQIASLAQHQKRSGSKPAAKPKAGPPTQKPAPAPAAAEARPATP